MAKLKVSEIVSLSPQAAWERAADLSRFDQWLQIHDGWRCELPTELHEGLQLTSVVSVKGMRNRIDWTMTEYSPIDHITLKGHGKGGTKVDLVLSIAPKGEQATFTLEVDFSGPMLFGLVGSGVARALKGDVQRSLQAFSALSD